MKEILSTLPPLQYVKLSVHKKLAIAEIDMETLRNCYETSGADGIAKLLNDKIRNKSL